METDPRPRAHASGADPIDELTVLRILCQGTLEPGEWRAQIQALDPAQFPDWTHRNVFEVLRALGTSDPVRIREQLPRLVTLRGFPETDVDTLFVAHGLSSRDARRILVAFHTTPPHSK